ncbi:unnamed protein product [Agarophyton chilense]
MRCPSCRDVVYCGRACQLVHWRSDHHALPADADADADADAGAGDASTLRFREVRIVTDVHPDVSDDSSSADSHSADSHSADSHSTDSHSTDSQHEHSVDQPQQQPPPHGTFQDADEHELPEELFHARTRDTDHTYKRFARVVAAAPHQVIRYERGGVPLWGAAARQCEQPPTCERCGAARVFELQLMPQLLYFVCGAGRVRTACARRDAAIQTKKTTTKKTTTKKTLELDDDDDIDLDWLTVCIFCCERSCGGDAPYVREFAWLQSGVPQH